VRLAPPPIPPMLVPPSVPKGGLRWHAHQRLALVRHRRTARFTYVLADSHGTSCPGLLCFALGRCRADRASHLATPAPAGYVLSRQTGFHAPLLSSLTAQTHARKTRSCVPHSRGHRPLLWLSHASHRTRWQVALPPLLSFGRHAPPSLLSCAHAPDAQFASTLTFGSLLCCAPCSAGLADSASALLRRFCARRTAAIVLRHRTGFRNAPRCFVNRPCSHAAAFRVDTVSSSSGEKSG